MNLLIGLALITVAVVVFVIAAVDSFLDRSRTLNAMEGPGRRRRFSLELWIARRKSPTTLFLLTAVFAAAAGLLVTHSIVGFAIGGGLGYIVPRLLYFRRARIRLKKLDEQFPSALVLVANGMRAGQTLVQAFDLAAGSLKEPIASEFLAVSRQIRLGMPVPDALASFSSRVPLPESTILVKAMQISILTGANLPAALGQVAATIASRAKLERRVKTLTAQGKAQGLVIGLAPIVLGVALSFLNPAYFKTMTSTFLGNCIIVSVLVLQTVGFLVVQKITKIPL